MIKVNGVHYTPPELADFLAALLVDYVRHGMKSIEVLDPACGNGSLLRAFAYAVPETIRGRLMLVGYETDSNALATADRVLGRLNVAKVDLVQQDFLTIAGASSTRGSKQLSLLDTVNRGTRKGFDVIIANPPYVRTQILGAAKSQSLARQFGLSGRVDLYHAFVKAMGNVLRPGGALGLLTSNRFLTIKSGSALRTLFRTEFSPRAIFDLGDTKLFSAAVLPVIVIATKLPCEDAGDCIFDRIYEHRSSSVARSRPKEWSSVFSALRSRDAAGLIRTPSGAFNVERGFLSARGHDEVWSLRTGENDDWLRTVARNTSHSFDDVVRIRVGIKSTADDVFLRQDWRSLPTECQPEPELLKPLIRHFDVKRWTQPRHYRQSVLYPHATERGRRIPVNLEEFPRTRRYLNLHRDRLMRRRYVVESGRQWYELWVPHSPDDWSLPKIVFPDISEEPRFSLDQTGAVVNGDCYWMTLRTGFPTDWLPLILAIANSTFITRYYDIAFHNKLYAGRRRFMYQYVRKFPLPDLRCHASKQLVKLVSEMLESKCVDQKSECEIDQLVWNAFGLSKEVER